MHDIYDCPIEQQIGQLSVMMANEHDQQIVKAVQQIGIEIDKQGLVEAINNDRRRYEAAYQRGYDAAIESTKTGARCVIVDLKTAKRYFEKDNYIWVKILYFSFGNSGHVYHLRITDICDEGIRVDAISHEQALPYSKYGECWEVYC